MLRQWGADEKTIEEYFIYVDSLTKDDEKKNPYSIAFRAIAFVIKTTDLQKRAEEELNQQNMQAAAQQRLSLEEMRLLAEKAQKVSRPVRGGPAPALDTKQQEALKKLRALLEQIGAIDKRLNDDSSSILSQQQAIIKIAKKLRKVQQQALAITDQERQRIMATGGKFEHTLTEAEKQAEVINYLQADKPESQLSALFRLFNRANGVALTPSEIKRLNDTFRPLVENVRTLSAELDEREKKVSGDVKQASQLVDMRAGLVNQCRLETTTLGNLTPLRTQPQPGTTRKHKEEEESIRYNANRSTIKV